MRCLILFIGMIVGFNGVTAFARIDPVFNRQARNDTLRLRLRDAILMALERNPDMAIQRLDPDITQSFADEERAAFDPSLTVSVSRNETKLQRFLGSRPEPFEMISTRTQYDIGLSETLPTGTVVSADVSLSGSISSIYTDQFSGNMFNNIIKSDQ